MPAGDNKCTRYLSDNESPAYRAERGLVIVARCEMSYDTLFFFPHSRRIHYPSKIS